MSRWRRQLHRRHRARARRFAETICLIARLEAGALVERVFRDSLFPKFLHQRDLDFIVDEYGRDPRRR